MVTSEPTIYIVGPMRGIPKFNAPAFSSAERHLQGLGYKTINPFHLEKTTPEEIATGIVPMHRCREYAKRDLMVICNLRTENDDGIYLLKGWQKSVGAMAEMHTSIWVHLKIWQQGRKEPPCLLKY